MNISGDSSSTRIPFQDHTNVINNLIITLMVILILLSSFLLPEAWSPGQQNAYRLVRQDKDISIYERWLSPTPDKKFREVKAEFVVNAGKQAILDMLTQEEAVLKWMNGISEYRIIRKEKLAWVSYIKYDIPWPLNDQDCVLSYQLKSDQANALIQFESDNDLVKEQSGITRLTEIKGAWHLISLAKDTTKVIYLIQTAQDPVLPRTITDPIVQRSLIKTMSSLKDESEKYFITSISIKE